MQNNNSIAAAHLVTYYAGRSVALNALEARKYRAKTGAARILLDRLCQAIRDSY